MKVFLAKSIHLLGKTRLYKNGLIANDILLVFKKWIIDEKNISLILSDSTTAFATMRDVVDTKDTMQCRQLLGLANNVDLALIFTVTKRTTRMVDKNLITSWIGSDLQGSNIKILIRSDLGLELRNVVIGTVCAILNPDVKQQVIPSDLKSITINRLDDILIIGELDGLDTCKAVTVKGESCKNLVYTHNEGDYCKYHLKFIKPDNKRSRTTQSSSKHRSTTNGINGDKNTSNSTNSVSSRVLKSTLSNVMQGLRSVMGDNKPYTFTEPPKPVKPTETMAKLGELNVLIQKIINNRSPTARNTINTLSKVNTPEKSLSLNNTPKNSANFDTERYNEFVRLSNLIKDYTSKREFNNLLGTLQMLTNKVKGTSSEVISKSNIMNICDLLLDHPLENIAVSALKLRRAIRKIIRAQEIKYKMKITREPKSEKNTPSKYKAHV
ncbi:uncharacterized protein TA07425 [Theileria annulata]|uniref:Uncharacterized protein n=1 Tax=Theileria annulata TaxID=5874 RepID=Q4UA61_THEAN|nr:uncharacterized protein TA07425 [Theileria annulata]CAI76292.1 hypothetical protein TA07425 [Theileria annulata]|eukprot:XP_952916.1 hypothetical protein TA07425 [Theileria annulata]